jgi:hypothetical protein
VHFDARGEFFQVRFRAGFPDFVIADLDITKPDVVNRFERRVCHVLRFLVGGSRVSAVRPSTAPMFDFSCYDMARSEFSGRSITSERKGLEKLQRASHVRRYFCLIGR